MNKAIDRNIGIDIVKFVAVLLITNSHMRDYYPLCINKLATGGVIGDALFFFCSGFTLFMKPISLPFDDWYKRRIRRIYPTVFAWAAICACLLGISHDMWWTLLHGGGPFVMWIMRYYVLFYFIGRFMPRYLNQVFVSAVAISVVAYFLWERPEGYSMYGATSLKEIYFFLFMLQGAIIGRGCSLPGGRKALAGFLLSVVAFYGFVIGAERVVFVNDWQLLSMLPLMCTIYFLFALCSCNKAKQLFFKARVSNIVLCIGGLCLEVYITQSVLLGIEIPLIFPLNYLSMFVLIFAASYLLRCCARIFLQTFLDKPYDWKSIFNPL